MNAAVYAIDALLAALGIFLIKRVLVHLRSRATLAPLPPGHAWLGWAEYATRFGALSRLSVFGTHIVVLHDPAAAAALFEKRSAVFSDRPRVVFGGEMCGWENTLALQRYGEDFRQFRKELHQVLGTQAAISKFHPLIEIETRRFLLRVLEDTTRLTKHVQTSAGAIILRMAYGYTIEPTGRDPLIALAEEGISQISFAAQPGAFVVDMLPFLRYIPEWVPGAGFQRTAKRFHATVTELVEKPYAFVKQQMAAGTAAPSYVSALLEKFDPEGRNSLSSGEEHVIKWSASSLYTGGADTSVSAIQSFFLAMLLHPVVLARAQAEVDGVTGCVRLPTFADRERLPYVNALVKEVLRWCPIAPMGLPHVNAEEVLYDGYRIPKGSICMPNIWQYAHNPDVYESPFDFRPERFLHDDKKGTAPERDVRDYIFGFGRRACPGKELADASLFMFVAASLAVFDFKKVRGADGQIKEPKFAFSPGTITHPEPFSINATPRSPAAAMMIRSVETEHPWDASDAEHLAHLDWRRGLETGHAA
ncbi:cytochrome P450 oxidoreductase [Phellopilus nigrolimitatus]|nr:cytochrome P450 oxidoreductase [Phellopilus nigrolimitatus]